MPLRHGRAAVDRTVGVDLDESRRAPGTLLARPRDVGENVVEADVANNPAQGVHHREVEQGPPDVTFPPVIGEWIESAIADLVFCLDPHLKCGNRRLLALPG